MQEAFISRELSKLCSQLFHHWRGLRIIKIKKGQFCQCFTLIQLRFLFSNLAAVKICFLLSLLTIYASSTRETFVFLQMLDCRIPFFVKKKKEGKIARNN